MLCVHTITTKLQHFTKI